ncbi:MAG: ribonuclease III [Telmatospirillum sp.]|nr:ribonuclease III [Telmatospirillum sp.]
MELRLNNISRALGYQFRRLDLLEEALTHSSACPARGRGGASGKARASYERLEFLGDRVLGLTVAEMLFFHFPKENEGALARRHAALVRREALARVAETLGLPDALVMSKGEEDSGGRQNPTILADACEAVLGAVYADSGLDSARTIVQRLWEPLMAESVTPPKDAKTGLQEWAQGRGKPLPVYQTLGVEGPQHDPVFLVSVSVEGFPPLTGRGASKRVAEQAAATAMLEKVTK